MASRLRFGLPLATLLVAMAVAQKLDEYQVKAAFVCNFASFVEWPAGVFRNQRDPFTICVMGRNPFGQTLANLAATKAFDGHAFVVREISDATQASSCQIVFISASERLRFRFIIDGLKTISALTVGDADDFISEGGMIALRLANDKIRLQINPQPAKEKNLRISAHLLSLAEISK